MSLPTVGSYSSSLSMLTISIADSSKGSKSGPTAPSTKGGKLGLTEPSVGSKSAKSQDITTTGATDLPGEGSVLTTLIPSPKLCECSSSSPTSAKSSKSDDGLGELIFIVDELFFH